MPTATEHLRTAIRDTIAETATSSPTYSSDELADLIVTAIGAAAVEINDVGHTENADTRVVELETRVAELEAQVASKSADSGTNVPTA